MEEGVISRASVFEEGDLETFADQVAWAVHSEIGARVLGGLVIKEIEGGFGPG